MLKLLMIVISVLLGISCFGLFIAFSYTRMYMNKLDEVKARCRQLLVERIEMETAITLLRQNYEKSRETFSKTLHDEVGNSLASIKVMVEALWRNQYRDDFDILFSIQNELIRSLQTVRNISKDGYPPSLKEYGLGFAIEELCERLTNPKLANILFEENTGSIRLHIDNELVLYRAVQELVGNAIKHSHACYVYVRLVWSENELVITVKDNGVGYGNWRRDRGGMGLKSIKSSLKTIKAEVFFDKERLGFKAHIKHPIYNGTYQSVYSG